MIRFIVDLVQQYPWVLIAAVMHGVVLGTVAYLILLERKVASWVQDRIGPNRVGFDFGLPFLSFMKGKLGGFGQPLADGIKFIVKEDYRAKGVDNVLFTLAPGVMILVIIISIAVLPWGGVQQVNKSITVPANATAADIRQAAVDHIPASGTLVDPDKLVAVPSSDGQATVTYDYRYPFQIANINVGVLFILAVLSLAVYGVVIGGWASNNKYSFLGGLRATAQMVSYEIPLGLGVIAIVVMHGTLDLGDIVDKQASYWFGFIPAWNVFAQPLTFLMFLVCIHAEANRAPFDLAEAEQELVGGYHTEYSAMRFALFFLAEYAGMITTSAVCVALFFGGWHLPWIEWLWPALAGNVDPGHHAITTSLLACIVRTLIYFGKTIGVIFVFMWVRWSLPRFRFDQLMQLAWRAMIPMSLGLLVMTAIVMYFAGGPGEQGNMRISGKLALALFMGNIVVLAVTMFLSLVIPPAPDTNRRLRIANSRYARTPLPLGVTAQARGPVVDAAVVETFLEPWFAMKDSDVIVLQEPKLTLSDQFYLPQVLIGLGTTMKHMLQVLGGRDRVVQYPEERREDLPVGKGGMNLTPYRGVHRLNKDEEGRVKCVACMMCSTACPARCIHIEAAESPWPDREKYPAKFDIDELRCIYCGMCEEACPVDAIELTSVYDIVGLTRQEMIFDKSKLLNVYDQTVKQEPM